MKEIITKIKYCPTFGCNRSIFGNSKIGGGGGKGLSVQDVGVLPDIAAIDDGDGGSHAQILRRT